MEFIEEFGDKGNKIIVKTDQEPSMTFLIKDLIEEREEGKTLQDCHQFKVVAATGSLSEGSRKLRPLLGPYF